MVSISGGKERAARQAAGKVGEQCMLPVPALVGVDSSSRIRALHWCQGFCPFITQTQGPRCVECAPRAGVLALAQANGAGTTLAYESAC